MGIGASVAELLWGIVTKWWLWLGFLPLSQLAFFYGLARPWLIKRWPWLARRVANRQARRAAKRTPRRWPQLVPLAVAGLLAALLISAAWVYHEMRTKMIAELGTLQQQLDDKAARARKADLLLQLIADGTRLFEEQLTSADQLPDWRRRADAWKRSALAAISAQLSPQEAGFFDDITAKTRPENFNRAVNDLHNALLKSVEAHLANLNTLLRNYLPAAQQPDG